MQKQLIGALVALGVLTSVSMPAIAVYLPGAQQAWVSVGTEWFFNQQDLAQPKSQAQCSEFWGQESYYLNGDLDSDGIPDMGRQWYFKDNFRYSSQWATRGVALIVPRFNQYIGTTVSYFAPTANMLNLYQAWSQYSLSSQKAFYRFSKVAPLNQSVRAIESEPFLIEAPQTRSANDANFQIVFDISFAPFSSWGTTTSDYFVATVPALNDYNPVPNSNKRWMKNGITNPDGPLWSSDYLNQTALSQARSINWSAEMQHGSECVNVKVSWCGDGIVNNTSFSNGVTATEQCDLGTQNGQPWSACTAQCTIPPVELDPDVSIVKSVVGISTWYKANDIVTFKILYRNIWSGLARNVVIRDELPAWLTFVSATSNPGIGTPTVNGQIITWPTLATLAQWAQWEIIVQARVSQFNACSQYTNNAVIAASNEPINLNYNNSSNASVFTECGNPDVVTFKSVTAVYGTYLPWNTVEYTLTYQNVGAIAANGVVVTDTLPSFVNYVVNSAESTPSIWQPSINGQTLSWNIGTLQPGQSGTIKIRVTIKSTTPTCSSLIVRNDFTISATNEPASLLGNNPSFVTFPMQCVDLFSNKTVDKAVIWSGEILTYTITYGNAWDVAMPATVTDTLPAWIAYILNSATSNPNIWQPNINGQTLTWNVGILPWGSTRTITIQARAVWDTSGKTFVNKVCIVDDNDYNNNNCGTAVTIWKDTTPNNIDLWSKKIVDKAVVQSWDVVTYTVTYGNSGNASSPATVVDTLPADIQYVWGSSTSNPDVWQPVVNWQNLTWDVWILPVWSSRTIRFQARVIRAVPNQQYINTVCISDDNNFGNNNCGTAKSTTPWGNQFYDLSIDKTPKVQITYSWQNVTFALTVNNAWPANVTNFSVKDYLPEGLEFVSATTPNTYDPATRTITWDSLSLNASWSLSLIVTAKYVAAGTVINYAEICSYNWVNSWINPRDVDSTPCNGTWNNEDDTSNAKVMQWFLDLNLNKYVNGEKEIEAFSWEVVDFSLVVGNSGTVAASNFTVHDYLPQWFVYIQWSAWSSYDATTRIITWSWLILSPGASTVLTFKAYYVDAVERTNYAEVCTYNWLNGTWVGPKDIDSDPCNRGAKPPVEDDESSALVRPRSSSNILDVSINKLIDGVKVKTNASSGGVYPVSLVVTNSWGVGIANFSVRDYMPAWLEFVPWSANPANVSYDAVSRIVLFTWLSIAPNQTITLTFNATYRSASNLVNFTEICDYRGTNASWSNAKDIDSNPCNRGATTPIEDDESSAQIGPGGGGWGWPTVDVTLNKLVNNVKEYQANNNEIVTFTLRASNEGNTTIRNVSIVDYMPANVEYVSGSASTWAWVTVSYDATSRKLVWSGLTFTNNSAFDLTFRAVYNGTEARTNFAEICAYNGRTNNLSWQPTSVTNPVEIDSDPCNRGANAPVEDDESQAIIKPRTWWCTTPGWCGWGGRNYCGDGVIARPNSYGQYEECDEWNNNGKPWYNCSTTCKTWRGTNPVCGNGTLEVGEVCDQWSNWGIIPAGRPYAGKTCTNKCNLPGVTTPACEYVDPPSIQSNEYLPYRWDLENIQWVRSSCTAAGDIVRSTMLCTFTVTDAKWNTVDQYDLPCFDRTPDVLTKSAYTQVVKSLWYDPDDSRIIPYGYDSRRFNFGNTLGEHKISLVIKEYDQCESDGKGGFIPIKFTSVNRRVCEMNFAVTKPYMVSRGPLGNFVSDPAWLTEFFYMPDWLAVFTSPVPKITQKFDVTSEVKDSIKKLVDEYKKVAVKATSLPEFGTVMKVPGKEIYFFEWDRDQSYITISDRNAKALSDKPFTIIVTRWQLVVKGNLANAGNGMYINASERGIIKFAMDDKEWVNWVKWCDVTQSINGIFISINSVESLDHKGLPKTVANIDQSQEWCNAGDLTIRWVLIWNGITENVVARRRSSVNSWFTELTSINADRKEYLLNHWALVLKYNPELFDNLPPGAEILAQVLNTYKK